MQLASTYYLAKLESINQTPIFPKIFTDFLENLFILYEKIKKWEKYRHAMLGSLLGQNTNIF